MKLNVMLSCAGRQAPLVQAFVDALAGRGKIAVADLDPFAAAKGPADVRLTSPGLMKAGYADWCLKVCREHEIGLWISFVEAEVLVLEGVRSELHSFGCELVGTPPDTMRVGMDKRAYADFLANHGIEVPQTLTLQEVRECDGMDGDEFIIKMRGGRGSRGLHRVNGAEALRKAAEASDAPNDWIAQPVLEGPIYCIDVINNLKREFAACLCRKRLAMGLQETDAAETISDARLEEVARSLSAAVRHQGCLDADVIDCDGRLYVIDLNLRFGGAHIYSLVAGANIPAALIAWRLGRTVDPAWLKHRNGEVLARYTTATRLPSIS